MDNLDPEDKKTLHFLLTPARVAYDFFQIITGVIIVAIYLAAVYWQLLATAILIVVGILIGLVMLFVVGLKASDRWGYKGFFFVLAAFTVSSGGILYHYRNVIPEWCLIFSGVTLGLIVEAITLFTLTAAVCDYVECRPQYVVGGVSIILITAILYYNEFIIDNISYYWFGAVLLGVVAVWGVLRGIFNHFEEKTHENPMLYVQR